MGYSLASVVGIHFLIKLPICPELFFCHFYSLYVAIPMPQMRWCVSLKSKLRLHHFFLAGLCLELPRPAAIRYRMLPSPGSTSRSTFSKIPLAFWDWSVFVPPKQFVCTFFPSHLVSTQFPFLSDSLCRVLDFKLLETGPVLYCPLYKRHARRWHCTNIR